MEREVGRINDGYGRVGVPAVPYLHQSYSRSELVALYCAAAVMMITPRRDGMNLVAKEYADKHEAAKRMRAMRRPLRAHDVGHWATSFLSAFGVSSTALPVSEEIRV